MGIIKKLHKRNCPATFYTKKCSMWVFINKEKQNLDRYFMNFITQKLSLLAYYSLRHVFASLSYYKRVWQLYEYFYSFPRESLLTVVLLASVWDLWYMIVGGSERNNVRDVTQKFLFVKGRSIGKLKQYYT